VSELAGTAPLARVVARRDRVRAAVWVGGIVALVLLTAASIKGLYPTQHDLDEAAAVTHGNAAAIAINGPDQALDTIGGQVAFQVGAIGLVVVALMNIFVVGHDTRGEEEAGRLELVRSMSVGRHAPSVAALVVVTVMNVAVGALVALGLIGIDLPVTGSLVFGASLVTTGLMFAAVALVVAQITENTRVVYGLSAVVLGVAYVLRAIGDVGDGTVSWLSPIGWAQKARPFAGEQFWPLLVPLAAAMALVVVASALAARRDIGAGLVAPRPGPARAPSGLGTPLGVAVRLQRGSVVGWAVGLFVGGAAYGSVANDIQDFVGDNQTLKDVLAAAGGNLTNSYLATSLLMLSLIASGFTISSVLRLRSEESASRAEPILATRTSRQRWLASHLCVALAGTLVMLFASGFGTGLAYALSIGDAGQVPRLVGAALAYAPAVWVLGGVTAALFGLAPRFALAAWAVMALCFVVALLDEVLGLPRWVRNLSPFEHTPQVPATTVTVVPLVVLTAIAAALVAAGSAGFRHRDIG
jgi:ABC-2 type transport system permease protein